MEDVENVNRRKERKKEKKTQSDLEVSRIQLKF